MEDKFFTPPATFVGVVKIKVTDINRSLAFYKEIIGFHVLHQTEKEVTLTADGKTCLLKIVQPDMVIAKEMRTTGLYHIALLLPSRGDLAAFLRHALHKQVELGAADHLVSEALYLSDPDGNGIEVYHDRPSAHWNWSDEKVSMATEPLDAEGILAVGSGEWGGLPMETKVGHIHLHVADLVTAERFYVQGLGLKVVTTAPGALFLSSAHYHHHVGVNIWNGNTPPAENSVGLAYFTLLFKDEESLLQVVAQLQKLDSLVEKKSGYYQTNDPSGNRIRLRPTL